MKRGVFLFSLAFVILGFDLGCVQWHPPGPPQAPIILFVVKWDGKVIPGITQISALHRKTEVVEHRTGDDSNLIRRSPGKTEYQPIVLKRPRTGDQEFERWANLVWVLGAGQGREMSLKNYRKDLCIEMREDTGRLLMAFRAYRCWPSGYVALSESRAEQKSAALEILVLEHEGWERDEAN
ncbi:MAG: phage tail protein [Syntrophaceae bacterium]|nr:phage tail protein [Syntrophaceae bacterium]